MVTHKCLLKQVAWSYQTSPCLLDVLGDREAVLEDAVVARHVMHAKPAAAGGGVAAAGCAAAAAGCAALSDIAPGCAAEIADVGSIGTAAMFILE